MSWIADVTTCKYKGSNWRNSGWYLRPRFWLTGGVIPNWHWIRHSSSWGYEKVKYLLQIPEQNGVDFDGISDTEIQEYFCAHYQNGRIILDENVERFFNIMLEDVDFNFESNIFSRFRRIMIESINENRCVWFFYF